MAASNTDKLKKYKSLFSTTLSTGIGTGTLDTITPATVTGLPTDTAITLTFDRVDSGAVATPTKLERITGVVSGGNLTSYLRGKDSTTEQAHSAGAVIEMIWNAQDWNDLIDWGLVEHNQNGTHKSALVTTLKATGAEVTTGTSDTKIITPKALADSGIVKSTDGTFASDSDNKIPTEKATKTYVDTAVAGVADWKQYSTVTPTSGTLDDPSFPIVFAGVDLTSILTVGMKIKIVQGTTKYFIITAIAFSTDTTVTLYGGTDYDLVATGTTAITAFYYSSARVPVGFPMSPAKWTVEVSSSADQLKANPTDNVWYNLSALNITIPIGVWKVEMMGNLYGYASTGKGLIKVAATLSTANNSQSDIDFSIAAGNRSSATSAQQIGTAAYKAKILSLAAKTAYYCNVWSETGSIAAVGFDGSGGTTFIRAICAYL